MKKVDTISSKKLKCVWVNDHYDFHIEGTCLYEGTLHRFILHGDFNDYYCEDKKPKYDIFELSLRERIRWKMRQWMFEGAVGYHWTYPHVALGQGFRARKPAWFWKLVFTFYYWANKKAES